MSGALVCLSAEWGRVRQLTTGPTLGASCGNERPLAAGQQEHNWAPSLPCHSPVGCLRAAPPQLGGSGHGPLLPCAK